MNEINEAYNMDLRGYQKDGEEKIISLFTNDRIKKIMYVLPTGAGKTKVFISLLKKAESNNMKCAVVCHLIELVSQTKEELIAEGVKCEVLTPETINANHYDFIVFDEAHHIAASTWLKTLEHCRGRVLAVTATPVRPDRKVVTQLFDSVVFGPTVRELVSKGYLALPDIWVPESKVPCTKISIVNACVTEYLKQANGKKFIVYAQTKRECRLIAKAFVEKGISAEPLLSDMSASERKNVVNNYKGGSVLILTTCGVIAEGFNVPDTDGVILARKITTSRILYFQQVGRALRVFLGKTVGIVHDHMCNSLTHGSPLDYDPEKEYRESPHYEDFSHSVSQWRGSNAIDEESSHEVISQDHSPITESTDGESGDGFSSLIRTSPINQVVNALNLIAHKNGLDQKTVKQIAGLAHHD